MVYGSRSGSDEAPLSDSEDQDRAAHDPDGMGGIGMDLSAQVIGRLSAFGSDTSLFATSLVCAGRQRCRLNTRKLEEAGVNTTVSFCDSSRNSAKTRE